MKKFVKAMVLPALVCTLLLGKGLAGNAGETEWTGAGGDSSWLNRANWNPGPTHAGITAKIKKPGSAVVIEKGNIRSRGIELEKGTSLTLLGGSVQASYSGVTINGGKLTVKGGTLTTGVPGKFPRRMTLGGEGSELEIGGNSKDGTPTVNILEQLSVAVRPEESGKVELSGYGVLEVGKDFTVGRYGKGSLEVRGGNLKIIVGGDFVCSFGGQYCSLDYVIDETGASTIQVEKDIKLGHGKRAFNRSKFSVRFADGFTPKPGTEYIILRSKLGGISNYPTFGNLKDKAVVDVDGVKLQAIYSPKSFKLVVL